MVEGFKSRGIGAIYDDSEYGSDIRGRGDGVLIVLSHFIFFGTSFSSFPVNSVSIFFQ